jgi:PqqD family protein of HPr-rel-A system
LSQQGRYRVAPGQQLRWRDWDGEVVLYNDLSGDTHLLTADALALLLALQEAPCAIGVLADLFGAADTEGLQAMLDELAGLALIELLPC